MLGKLIKYDIKWLFRFMIPFLILSLILSSMTRIFFELENANIIFKILYFTTMFIANGILIATLIQSIIRVIIRFKNQIYGDESYLVHTIPVKRKNIITSKIIAGITCILTTIIIVVLCLFIEYFTVDRFHAMQKTFEMISSQLGLSVSNVLLSMIPYILFTWGWILLMVFAAIQLGYRKNDKKITMSFIYAFILYLVMEVCNLIGLGIFCLFNSNMWEALQQNTLPNDIFLPFILMYTVLAILYFIAYYFINLYLIKRKLNID